MKEIKNLKLNDIFQWTMDSIAEIFEKVYFWATRGDNSLNIVVTFLIKTTWPVSTA